MLGCNPATPTFFSYYFSSIFCKFADMKKILLLLLCFPLISICQNFCNHLPTHSVDSYQYLISDNVNIRLGPSNNTPVVANLPIASRLKIIEVSSEKYTYNNIISPWCKVSFILDGIENTGYVVGVFIAAYYKTIPSKNLVILSGISECDSQLYVMKNQICIAKNNKEIDKIDFHAPKLSGFFRDIEYYSQDVMIIEMSYAPSFCTGGIDDIKTFFFDHNKLYQIRILDNRYDEYLNFINGTIQVIHLEQDDCKGGCYEACGCYIEEVLEEYIWEDRILKRKKSETERLKEFTERISLENKNSFNKNIIKGVVKDPSIKSKAEQSKYLMSDLPERSLDDLIEIKLKGVNEEYDFSTFFNIIIDGVSLNSDSSIFISENIANKLELKFRDKILVYFPLLNSERLTVRAFYVCGIYKDKMNKIDEFEAFISLSRIRRMLKVD